MPELIEQYAKKFNENFPLFALMGMDDEEVEAIIQDRSGPARFQGPGFSQGKNFDFPEIRQTA